MKKKLKQWRFTLILIFSVIAGALLGHKIGPQAKSLKPLGDVFLNLLFTAVVPLVFFSLSSAIASNSDLKRLGRMASLMLAVFIVTGIISSCIMIFAVKTFDPADGLDLDLTKQEANEPVSLPEKIVSTFSVKDFPNLISRHNILPLMIFSILIGLASQAAGEKGKPFRKFLVSGAEVMGQLIKLIMYYAPIGLGAYFAYLVGVFGPQLMSSYARVVALYYPVAALYFVIVFSIYAFAAAGRKGVRGFWTHIPPAALTALGTGSSLAALPANLESAKRIGVPEDVREIVLPIGATIHMDGSCLAAILKIAVLFSIFGKEFTGIETYASAIGISLLCGVVMSGIPGGGFLGEALIVSFYGFPLEALPIISMLGVLVDPIATMINSSGDTIAAMITTRLLGNNKIAYIP
ncbi:MAG: dicarboxylate/amino acid:cation symporter [Planctomycetes bacterium]|nr:dicarboxylate/amino acid:cation symporter [Planctomycetota bacterium]